MKEKKYEGKTLAEVEVLAVSELGIAKEDMYFDEISEKYCKIAEQRISNEKKQ